MVRRRRLVAPLVVALVASLCSLVAGIQPAAAKVPPPAQSLVNVGVTSAGPAGDGYWEVTDGGLVAPLREAPDDPLPAWYGDMSGSSLNAPIVGIAGHPNGGGYWFVGRDGGVFAYGSAGFFGGSPANNIVGITATPDGGGYWLLGADGGIFAYGNAPFKGSLGGQGYTDVVGMAATPSGQGYWLVRANGAIYSYGDAGYHGGAAASNIVGMARTFDGGGYWLLGADGAIYADNAPNYGRGAVLCCGFTYSAIVAKRNLHDGYRLIGRNTSDFPGFEPNKAPIGNVDTNSDADIAGWAVDPNTTTTAVTVQIIIDGVQQFSQATSVNRDDVNAAYHGISGIHGFDVVPSPIFEDGRAHTAQVWALDSSGDPSKNTLLVQTTWTGPNLAPAGLVERADSQISGWAHDPTDPTHALTINIYLDGASTPTATVAANGSRPNNNPPSNDGFSWAVPASYQDGKSHTLRVDALDSTTGAATTLTNSSYSFLYLADSFTGADGSAWNPSAWNTSLNDLNRTIDISGNSGLLSVAGSTVDAQAKQVVTSSDPSLDSDTTLSYQFVNPGDLAKLKIAARGSSSITGSWMSDGYQAEIRSYSNVVKIYRVAGGTRTELGGFSYTPGSSWQSMRMLVTGTSPAVVQVKMWPKGSTEPGGWNVIVTDATPVMTPGVLHVSLTNGGTTSRTALVDDVNYQRLLNTVNKPNSSTAPTNSISRYINLASCPATPTPCANFTLMGQNEANRAKTPPGGAPPYAPLIILGYGAQDPIASGGTPTGASGYGYDRSFQQIQTDIVNFINGYYSVSPSSELSLVVGTTNDGYNLKAPDGGESDARGRGIAWAQMMNQIWSQVQTAHPKMALLGGNDFESGSYSPQYKRWLFGGPAPAGPRNAKAWVSGWTQTTRLFYADYGSADGCPTAGTMYSSGACPVPGQTGNQAWTQDDYWTVAFGAAQAYALPQTYNACPSCPNTQAPTWRELSKYGYNTHGAFGGLLNFVGALTQSLACSTGARPCASSTIATPSQGWTALRQAMDNDGSSSGPPTKGLSIGFSTDIGWEGDCQGGGVCGG